MGIFSILGDGLRAIGDGMGAIGRALFGPGHNPEEDHLDRLTAEQERADWAQKHARYTSSKNVQDITITEGGVRKHVRMEDGKVVSSENVDDPEAFVKEHMTAMDETFSDMDKTFSDMSANMDKTFSDMDNTFNNMFGNRRK